jgi:hypothetical protein
MVLGNASGDPIDWVLAQVQQEQRGVMTVHQRSDRYLAFSFFSGLVVSPLEGAFMFACCGLADTRKKRTRYSFRHMVYAGSATARSFLKDFAEIAASDLEVSREEFVRTLFHEVMSYGSSRFLLLSLVKNMSGLEVASRLDECEVKELQAILTEICNYEGSLPGLTPSAHAVLVHSLRVRAEMEPVGSESQPLLLV